MQLLKARVPEERQRRMDGLRAQLHFDSVPALNLNFMDNALATRLFKFVVQAVEKDFCSHLIHWNSPGGESQQATNVEFFKEFEKEMMLRSLNHDARQRPTKSNARRKRASTASPGKKNHDIFMRRSPTELPVKKE